MSAILGSHQYRFLASVILSTLLIFISGCSDDKSQSALSSTAEPKAAEVARKSTVALVMKTLTNPFFLEMERGAREAEQELGVELIVKTAAQETSIQQQIEIVAELIRQQVDAIVIAPGDSIELLPVLKQAQEAGIIVINIDNRLDPEYIKELGMQKIPFISVDNEQASYFVVKTLIDGINQPTSAAILEGIRGAANAEDRKNGALRAFSENEFVTVVAMETAQWKIDKGFDVTKEIFEKNPEVKLLFCANDMMGLGALEYLKTADRPDVLVASYDALDAALEAIRAGNLLATVDQQAAEQGYQGVLFAHRAILGEKLPSVILIDAHTITVDNLPTIKP